MFNGRESEMGPSAIKGVVQVAEDVLLTDLLEHGRSSERDERLRVNVRDENERPVATGAMDEVLERMHARRVDRRARCASG